MNCPYCKKYIYALTGLQELQKFQKHLINCKKNPNRKIVNNSDYPEFGPKTINLTSCSIKEALNIRAESGQWIMSTKTIKIIEGKVERDSEYDL